MAIERVRTGIAELDEILGGGFPANSIIMVIGAPGSGKTILAEQLVFANATAERPAIYLSTLSEPLEKFIIHGQTYGFFDAPRVGSTIFYEDLGLMLKERGISALPQVITELIVQRHPKIIVIDSFKALETLWFGSNEERLILFDLASVLSAYECTSFLVGEYAPEMITQSAGFAIADGVIQLAEFQSGMRAQRFLNVIKLRGSGSVPGLHAFNITGNGIQVYPRLLSPPISPDYTPQIERLNTGIHGLDDMIEQGFWRGTTTLVAGPTGVGKTVIGLHFIIEGARTGEHGIYVGFRENPVQIKRAIQNFGWDADELFNKGFEHMYRSSVEMQIDSVVLELVRRVRQKKVKRVVIDALGDLKRRSFDQARLIEYLYALTQWFAVEGVTSLLLWELPMLFEFHHISEEEVSYMSDNILLMRFTPDEQMARTIRIIKTRNSHHDHFERILHITPQGAQVMPVESGRRSQAKSRQSNKKRSGTKP